MRLLGHVHSTACIAALSFLAFSQGHTLSAMEVSCVVIMFLMLRNAWGFGRPPENLSSAGRLSLAIQLFTRLG